MFLPCGVFKWERYQKVMNNAMFIFEEPAIVMKEGKRPKCILTDANNNALCLHFQGVFVLWDGVVLLARTVGPPRCHGRAR